MQSYSFVQYCHFLCVGNSQKKERSAYPLVPQDYHIRSQQWSSTTLYNAVHPY